MKTKIININPEEIEEDKLGVACKILKKEGVVIYPTETYYGLGAGCFFRSAVKQIYGLKKRDDVKPMSVVISDIGMLSSIMAEMHPLFPALAAAFWPGPLTMIFKATPPIPQELLGAGNTVGVRLPSHPWLRALVKCAGFPLIATSANVSGQKAISDPDRVISKFEGKVELIINGGKTPGKFPSSVIDLSTDNPKILRDGAVPASELKKYLP